MISHDETNGTCVTWHSQKELYQNLFRSEDVFVSLILWVPKKDYDKNILLATVNEQNVSGIHQNPHLAVLPNLLYHVTLSKTAIICKQYPCPSHCTYKTRERKFPGLYNQDVCKFVNNDSELVKTLGNQDQKCPLACEETSFHFSTTVLKQTDPCHIDIVKLKSSDGDDMIKSLCDNKEKDNAVEFSSYHFLLSYHHPQVYITIEEKEIYPLAQMLGKIGGFVGLMIGASFLSFLELIIFIILTAVKGICR